MKKYLKQILNFMNMKAKYTTFDILDHSGPELDLKKIANKSLKDL